MSDYDFHELSPPDFEKLSQDLLQADWGIKLESFKTGKDGGIDLRYAHAGGRTIIQCKHYVRTGLTGLLRDLGKEKTKVLQLKPLRYVLVTSVPLSPANKDEIVKIIGERWLQTGDILGRDDLNNAIARHPEIEGSHYKLWLTSRAVLDRVLNNAILTQTDFKVQQVYREIPRYVPSDVFPRALATLDNNRVVIIAGPPGVGKTTLANILLYQHLEKGYKAIVIQRDIREGQVLLQDGERQIFYFDDFMGAVNLGDRGPAFDHNEDRAILDFVAMVRASPWARLVLTTREPVLNQALARSERLRNSDIIDHRVVLGMPDYTMGQRAQILYNHLYFSDLPPEYKDELLRDDFYLEIVKHTKFNPRLIEWLSTHRRIKSIDVNAYREFVRNLLRDPSEIWRHAYDEEISDAGRSLLLALFTLGGRVATAIMEPAFEKLHHVRGERYGYRRRPEDFRAALRELAGSFIRPASPHAVEVLDPSVLDLLNSVMHRAPENAVDLLQGAAICDQIDHLWSFAKRHENVISALARSPDLLATALAARLHDARRVELGGGNIGYRGTHFERRLAVLIKMTDRMRLPSLLALVRPLADRLFEEWDTEPVNLLQGIEILRAFGRAEWTPLSDMTDVEATIRSALVANAATGCDSNELRELISVLELGDEPHDAILQALGQAYRKYKLVYFNDELKECRSNEQFAGLLDDLELFQSTLGFDLQRTIEEVEGAKEEFEQQQAEYAEDKQDEWKDQWRQDRARDSDIRDMFGSLRSDRE